VTHCDQLLQVLSDGRPHDHRQLYALGMVVHSRVADLRSKGHDIVCWREGDGAGHGGQPGCSCCPVVRMDVHPLREFVRPACRDGFGDTSTPGEHHGPC
jgi:hypothetical protein